MRTQIPSSKEIWESNSVFVLKCPGLGPEQAQARAHAGMGLGQSQWAWIFGLFSKSLSPSPILLNKHPGLQKAQARCVKPQAWPEPAFCKPDPALPRIISGRIRSYNFRV
jgi:hypothetical protein